MSLLLDITPVTPVPISSCTTAGTTAAVRTRHRNEYGDAHNISSRRVPLTPLFSWWSTTTTSTGIVANSHMAMSPLPAWPTTTMSCSADSTVCSPCRTTGWSSTTYTRIASVTTDIRMSCLLRYLDLSNRRHG